MKQMTAGCCGNCALCPSLLILLSWIRLFDTTIILSHILFPFWINNFHKLPLGHLYVLTHNFSIAHSSTRGAPSGTNITEGVHTSGDGNGSWYWPSTTTTTVPPPRPGDWFDYRTTYCPCCCSRTSRQLTPVLPVVLPMLSHLLLLHHTPEYITCTLHPYAVISLLSMKLIAITLRPTATILGATLAT